jgi:hypothetical protein
MCFHHIAVRQLDEGNVYFLAVRNYYVDLHIKITANIFTFLKQL